MNLYVWNKSNFTYFDNFYGESMMVVVADSVERAFQIVKEKSPDYLATFDTLQNWPSYLIDFHGTEWEKNKSRSPWPNLKEEYFSHFVKDGKFNTDKEIECREWQDALRNRFRQWCQEHWTLPNGLSKTAYMPTVLPIEETLLLSRASD